MKTMKSLIALTTALFLSVPSGLFASSHREAPITALDRAGDVTDVYAFRSYGPSATIPKVTMIVNVDPLLEPANGPTFFPFDHNILYEIKVDNDQDGLAEITFQFRFSPPKYDLPGIPVGLAGNDGGVDGVIPPQISTFDNPGLNSRQTYTVTMVKNGVRTLLTNSDGSEFFVVPDNIGPRTLNYDALFNAATYTNLSVSGISVFAGTVDDPFFIDLGAAFDTFNFRNIPGGSGVPGVLTASEDAARQNFASDTVSGYAVNTIAIEVPVAMLTSTGKVELATSPAATIGVWGTTSRPQETIRRSPLRDQQQGPFKQVQREGNPLINELVIGIGSKDRYSMDQPVNDSQFAHFFLNPAVVTVVDALYGVLAPGALFSPPAPRTDLLPLVQYMPPIAAAGTPPGPIADLLRLNTGVAPTPPASASRLGLLAGDPAGYPNGRRLFDDAVDITLRVAVGGVLAGNKCGSDHKQPCNVFPNNKLGDGVNMNDVAFHPDFPYVGDGPSGRNRRHIDPGEPGCSSQNTVDGTTTVGRPCPVN
jgi:Domain of unknown function (DUF4331)